MGNPLKCYLQRKVSGKLTINVLDTTLLFTQLRCVPHSTFGFLVKKKKKKSSHQVDWSSFLSTEAPLHNMELNFNQMVTVKIVCVLCVCVYVCVCVFLFLRVGLLQNHTCWSSVCVCVCVCVCVREREIDREREQESISSTTSTLLSVVNISVCYNDQNKSFFFKEDQNTAAFCCLHVMIDCYFYWVLAIENYGKEGGQFKHSKAWALLWL